VRQDIILTRMPIRQMLAATHRHGTRVPRSAERFEDLTSGFHPLHRIRAVRAPLKQHEATLRHPDDAASENGLIKIWRLRSTDSGPIGSDRQGRRAAGGTAGLSSTHGPWWLLLCDGSACESY